MGDLASAIGARSQEEAAIVAELKAGSETAYAWLIGEFQHYAGCLSESVSRDEAVSWRVEFEDVDLPHCAA